MTKSRIQLMYKFYNSFRINPQEFVGVITAPQRFLGNYFDTITSQINTKLGLSSEMTLKIDKKARLDAKLSVMEMTNPSLRERNYSNDKQIGVDFLTNQPKYESDKFFVLGYKSRNKNS